MAAMSPPPLLSSWPFPVVSPLPSVVAQTTPHLLSSPLLSSLLHHYPSLCGSLLTSFLSSAHSHHNNHRIEDPYWIIVFAISLWVDGVITSIQQGPCKPDPANPAFALPRRTLGDLCNQRFGHDGENRAPAFVHVSSFPCQCAQGAGRSKNRS